MIKYCFFIFLLLSAGVMVEMSDKPGKEGPFVLLLFGFIYLLIVAFGGGNERS